MKWTKILKDTVTPDEIEEALLEAKYQLGLIQVEVPEVSMAIKEIEAIREKIKQERYL